MLSKTKRENSLQILSCMNWIHLFIHPEQAFIIGQKEQHCTDLISVMIQTHTGVCDLRGTNEHASILS